MNPIHSTPSFVPPLSGVRGYLMCSILIWHYFTGIIEPQSFDPWLASILTAMRQATSMNWLAMDTFFVLSGFLIGRILMWHRDSENYFRAFYVRRALRIFPAYYLVLMLFFVVPALLPAPLPWLFDNPVPGWTYWVYLQNFWQLDGFGANWTGATWSLAVEEQFYLLFPVVIYLTPRRRIPWLVLAGMLTALIVRVLVEPLGQYAGYVLLPARMDALLAGAMVAWISLYANLPELLRTRRSAVLMLLAASVGGILLAKFVLREGLGGPVIHLASTLLNALLIAWAVGGDHAGRAARFLSNRPAVWLANISYMLYLSHQPILGLTHGLVLQQAPAIRNATDAGVTLMAAGLALGFCTLSYRLFEQPLMRLGKQFNYRQRPESDLKPSGAESRQTSGYRES